MNNISRHFAACLMLSVLTVIAGCATEPTPLDSAREIGAERIFVPPLPPSSSTSELVIIRDTGLYGAEHVFSIYLNGQHLSDLRQAERFMTRVQSGPALLELRMYNLSQTVTPVQVETS